MKIARIKYKDSEHYCILEDNKLYRSDATRNDMGIESFFSGIKKGEFLVEANDDDIEWLSPVARPGKIICVGRNYKAHSEEQGRKPEDKPLLFTKYSTAMLGHLSAVDFPGHSEFFDYEVELAVIIGKEAKKVVDNPRSYVFGYTVANDLTARDVQKSEKQWTRGKAFDSSLPIGPYIVTDANPEEQTIWLTVNGEERQISNTSNMIFDIDFLIEYISRDITLEPGDIILTGTPAGVGYYMEPVSTLQPGDQVNCGVSNIAELSFKVKSK